MFVKVWGGLGPLTQHNVSRTQASVQSRCKGSNSCLKTKCIKGENCGTIGMFLKSCAVNLFKLLSEFRK